MPIYKVTSPDKSVRIVEAAVPKAALNHVVKSDYKVEALSSVQLSALIRENRDLEIEQVAKAEADDAQVDVEDVAKEATTDTADEDNGDFARE